MMNLGNINLNKQFFSYLATYLVGSWSLIQFVEWFCKRYNFSNGWTDIIGIALLLLLPSVLLFSWIHADEAHQFKKQKLVYSLNIGLLLMMLVPISQGFSLTSTTEKLKVTDEHGVEQEVEVSKQEYIRQIAFLPFQNDKNEAWLSHAFPTLISTDINQCKRFKTYSSAYFIDELKELDYAAKDAIPQNIKEKLTNDISDYIISGIINEIENAEYAYEIELYSRKTAKALIHTKGTTKNIYGLADSLSVALGKEIFKTDLKIPFDDYKDIPAKELYSAKEEALAFYFKSRHQFYALDDYSAALKNIEKAIAIDNKFAEAYNLRGRINYAEAKIEAGRNDLEKALQLSNSISDYQQRNIKRNYYNYSNNTDKYQDFLEMWIKIHPEDDAPFASLMQIHINNKSHKEAIKVANRAEAAGHTKRFLFISTQLYAQIDEKEKVGEYLLKYKEAFPDDDEIEKKIGRIYSQQYLHEDALKHYEAYNTLNPLDIDNNIKISYCLFQLSQYDESIALLENLVAKAKNYSDSVWIFDALEYRYADRGEMKKSIALMNQRHAFSEKHTPLLGRLMQKASNPYFYRYHSIGEYEQSEKNIAAVGKLSEEHENFALANYYLATENAQKFTEFMATRKKFIEKNTSPEYFKLIEALGKKFNKDYEGAITIFEAKLETEQSDEDIEGALYDCYRLTQQYDKAIKGYEALLKKMPSDGEIILKYAQCLNDTGQVDAAKEELKKLMILWKNADPEYIYYQEALELDKQINLAN